MSDKRDYQQECLNIMAFIADSIWDAPDEEIMKEMKEEGLDPRAVAENVRNILLQTSKSYRQNLRKKLLKEVEVEKMQRKVEHFNWPSSPQAQRDWLQRVLDSLSARNLNIFTFQHRDFSNLTDSDVQSHLETLDNLGVLKDFPFTEK